MERKLKSLKINFLYNLSLKILNIIFPLITFPYVARVLTAEGIGKVDFSLSVIQYFILLSQFGIPTYAIRECAKHRHDKDKLAKTVQEILTLNFIMIFLVYILFFIIVNSVEELFIYKNLLIIMSLSIITTNMGIEWFYQAIEDYRYITIVNFIVKLVTLIAVFMFVKNESDYFTYGLITVLSLSIGYLFNFVYVNKHIQLFKKYSGYKFKRHIKPIIILFAMTFSISVYINLDKVMLGFISGDTSVGLYSSVNKVIMVIIALITSLGAVLLPRMSYYIGSNSREEINLLIRKSIDFIFMISIPATIGILILSKPIIILFAGNDYSEAVSTLRILSPIIIAIGLSNLIGIQVLVSHGKEKLTVISTVIGAIMNFSLNIVLIPVYQQNGAAISTLIAEITVTVVQIVLAFSYLKGNIMYKNILSYIFGSCIIILICLSVSYLEYNEIITIVISVLFSSVGYFGILYILKNELVRNVISNVIKKTT